METHGHTAGKFSPTYHSWACMVQRCTNPNRSKYKRYGPLGVDARWLVFANFLADMGERPPGTTLDRKDGTKGYYPGNCRWATPVEQALNRPSTKYVTIDGVTMCASHWVAELGVKLGFVRSRMRRQGRSYQEVLTDIYAARKK